MNTPASVLASPLSAADSAPEPVTAPRTGRSSRLDEIERFCTDHGCQPSYSGDAQQKKLYAWVTRHRREGTLPAAAAQILDRYPTAAQLRHEDRQKAGQAAAEARAAASKQAVLNRRIAQLRDFVETHDRLPARRAEEPQEKSLANWAYGHRRLPNPNPEAMDLMAAYGGFTGAAPRRITLTRRRQLRQFLETHGRLPDRLADDAAEHELALWAQMHLQKRHPDPETIALIQTHGGFPAASARRRPRKSTEARVAQLREFLEAHGRLPATRSQDEQERSLAWWAYSQAQRKNPHPETMSLIASAGGWHAQPTSRKAQQQTRDAARIAQLQAFVETHGDRPLHRVHDREEMDLALWVDGVLRRQHPLPEVTELLAKCSRDGSASTHHAVSRRRTAELRDFIEEHGRLPRHAKYDRSEKALAMWVSKQAYRRHPNPEVAALVAEHSA